MNQKPNCPELFKYMKREYADLMVNEGRVRIALLNYYKNIELGTAIGDMEEGKRSLKIAANPNGNLHIDNITVTGPSANSKIEFIDCKFTNTNNIAIWYEFSPPIYIYCASMHKSREIMNAFEADSCIRIHKPIPFFKELAKEVFRLKGPRINGFYGPEPCVYKSRNLVLDGKSVDNSVINQETAPAYLQKEPELAYQAEVRGMWFSAEPDPEEFIYLQCDAIRDMCEIVSI